MTNSVAMFCMFLVNCLTLATGPLDFIKASTTLLLSVALALDMVVFRLVLQPNIAYNTIAFLINLQ